MLGLLAAIAAALPPVALEAPSSLGACAWSRTPATVRARFLSAYEVGINEGTAVLAQEDPALSASFFACAGRSDVPKLWVQGAVGSTALQDGAAAELSAQKHLDRSALDAAWLQAPTAARDCTRANAAKVYGLKNEPCSDPRAPLWFLAHFRISPQTDRTAASQLLIYYNAKAQDEWAEAFIGKFKAQTPAPPH